MVAPTRHLPTDEELFQINKDGQRVPNLAFIKDHFCREGRLKEEQAIEIIEGATKILDAEPNMLQVQAPITGTSHLFMVPFL